MGEAIAKPLLSMTFLNQTEERDRRFLRVRLLILIKGDKYVGFENLMTLKVIRLYLNKMQYVISVRHWRLPSGLSPQISSPD